MDVVAQLVFEPAYYEVVVQHVNPNITVTPSPDILLSSFLFCKYISQEINVLHVSKYSLFFLISPSC